jgi:hypothetical protein
MDPTACTSLEPLMIACRNSLFLAIAGVCAAGAALGAYAADLPVLKPGLWEVTRSTNQQSDKKRLTSMCLDDSVQAEMRDFSLNVAKDMCTQHERRVEGNKMTVKATCKLGATTMKTESVMVFSGNTAYHTEGKASYDPPFMNMTEATSVMDGKWTGPCKAGQVPGDIVTETGQTINMKAMMKK